MTLKTLTDKYGRTFKMGRKPPEKPFEGPRLKDFLVHERITLPPMPFGYGVAAAKALAQVYGNANWGDCVIAARQHIEGIVAANAGDPIVYTDTQSVAEYGVCGFDPSKGPPGQNPTDQGCDIQVVLNHWISPGFSDGGNNAAGFLAVDPTNIAEIQTAIWLFENLVPGMNLPDAWVNPMPSTSGFLWTVAGNPDPNNGHCPAFYDVTAVGAVTSTWGMVGVTTYAAIAEYCAAANGGELYAVLTPDLISKAMEKAPNGLDWPGLVAAFDAMGGTVPQPIPVPPPTPPPVPPSPTPPPHPTPPPAPIPSPINMVAFPVNTIGIVIAGQGHHPQHVVKLPPHAIGIAVSK